MSRVNPRVDFAFKRLFGVEENADLLKSLINAVLHENDPIVHIDLLNPYNEKQSLEAKSSILDIKARDEKGRRYNIEMQVGNQDQYDKRSLYYWAKLYSDTLSKGEPFSKLIKTIGIHILNFNFLKEETHYHNIYEITNRHSRNRRFDDLEFHLIELDKFDVKQSKLKSLLERWITFLKSEGISSSKSDILNVLQSEPTIKKAIDTLERLNFTKDERAIYEGQLKRLRDQTEEIRTAWNQGLREGMEKGKVEGIREGIQEGKRANAAKMLQKGYGISDIADITGLSEAEIEALR